MSPLPICDHDECGNSICKRVNPPCSCSLCGDWIDDGGIYEVDSINRPICDSCAQWLIMRMPIGAGAAALIDVNIDNLDQETHKSQPEHIPLRSGVIGAGGSVDIPRTTADPLPDSNPGGQIAANTKGTIE